MLRIKQIYKMVLVILLVLLSPFIALGLIRLKIDHDKTVLTAATYEIAQTFDSTPERFLSEQAQCNDFYISATCMIVLAFETDQSKEEIEAIIQSMKKDGEVFASPIPKNDFIRVLSSTSLVYVDEIIALDHMDELPKVPVYGVTFRTSDYLIDCHLYFMDESPAHYIFQEKPLQKNILTIGVLWRSL